MSRWYPYYHFTFQGPDLLPNVRVAPAKKKGIEPTLAHSAEGIHVKMGTPEDVGLKLDLEIDGTPIHSWTLPKGNKELEIDGTPIHSWTLPKGNKELEAGAPELLIPAGAHVVFNIQSRYGSLDLDWIDIDLVVVPIGVVDNGWNDDPLDLGRVSP